jgi:hypothetical protein
MLIIESALQMPRFTHTARMVSFVSPLEGELRGQDTAERREENGQNAKEQIRPVTHGFESQ